MNIGRFVALLSIITVLGGCSDRGGSNGGQSVGQKRERDVNSERVMIEADLNVLGDKKHMQYRIPKDAETLAILSSPGSSVSNITGLGQLPKVRKLILDLINEIDPLAPKLPPSLATFRELEVLDLGGCTFRNLDFVDGFLGLRTLVLRDTEVRDEHNLDFTRLKSLEGVWLNGIRIQGQSIVKNGILEPAPNPLPFDAVFSPSVRILYLSSDQFPLHFAEGFFERNSDIAHIFILKESFEAGKNDVDLSKYPNVRLVTAQDGSDTKLFIGRGEYYGDIVGDWRSYPTIN